MLSLQFWWWPWLSQLSPDWMTLLLSVSVLLEGCDRPFPTHEALFKQYFKASAYTKFYISLNDSLCSCSTICLLNIHCMSCSSRAMWLSSQGESWWFIFTSVFCIHRTSLRGVQQCPFPEETKGQQAILWATSRRKDQNAVKKIWEWMCNQT